MENGFGTSPVDTVYLEEITGGDTEFQAELLNDFLNGAETLLAELETALAGDDARQVHHVAHTLKGSGNAIGAKAFGAICLEFETAGREDRLADVRDRQDALAAALDAVRQWAEPILRASAA